MVAEKQRTPLKTIAELYVECFTVIVFDQLNIYIRTASIYSELGRGSGTNNSIVVRRDSPGNTMFTQLLYMYYGEAYILLDDKVISVPHWICGTL